MAFQQQQDSSNEMENVQHQKIISAEPPGIENFQIISSQRGGKKLLFDGNIYVKKKRLSDGREKFECSERQQKFCYGAVTFREGKIEEILKGHNHAPNIAKIEAAKIKDAMKKKAENTVETPHQIVQSISDDLDIAVAGNIMV